MDFLQLILFGNSLSTWLVALGITLFMLVVLKIAKRLVLRRLSILGRFSQAGLDDLTERIIKESKSFFFAILAVFIGAQVLSLPENVREFLRLLAIAAFLLQVGFWSNGVIAYSVERKVKENLDIDAGRATTFGAFGLVAKIVVWVVVALVILDNLPNVEITTLIAGLGIGGIAVALAVQNILGDLFSSFTIILDKPFVIGDFIIVDDYRGTVEHIGLKSTRIRSLTGEQLVFANSDLLSSRVRNYKRMARRRILFKLGVTYQTPVEKLAAIPGMIREIITAHPEATFERAHFHEYGDFSLNFEVVYFVESAEYVVYMDIQQAINLALYQCFEENGIFFAYPTQTLFLAKEKAPASPPAALSP